MYTFEILNDVNSMGYSQNPPRPHLSCGPHYFVLRYFIYFLPFAFPFIFEK